MTSSTTTSIQQFPIPIPVILIRFRHRRSNFRKSVNIVFLVVIGEYFAETIYAIRLTTNRNTGFSSRNIGNLRGLPPKPCNAIPRKCTGYGVRNKLILRLAVFRFSQIFLQRDIRFFLSATNNHYDI
jgi:hypothetical protein